MKNENKNKESKKQDTPKAEGYLCEGGQQCPHGSDSTHWVELKS